MRAVRLDRVQETVGFGENLNEDFVRRRHDGVEEFDLKRGNTSFLPVHHQVGVEAHLPLQVALRKEFRVNQLGHSMHRVPRLDLIVQVAARHQQRQQHPMVLLDVVRIQHLQLLELPKVIRQIRRQNQLTQVINRLHELLGAERVENLAPGII